MSAYLLDSHVLLWLDTNPRRISTQVVSRIRSSKARVYASTLTAYELGVKFHQGRLPEAEALSTRFEQTCRTYDTSILQVKLEDFHLAAQLDWNHGDPADRIIAAQAIRNRCILVSADAKLQTFGKGLQVLWE
jgi:PIN domain nuclease of toxin-antitoxin system